MEDAHRAPPVADTATPRDPARRSGPRRAVAGLALALLVALAAAAVSAAGGPGARRPPHGVAAPAPRVAPDSNALAAGPGDSLGEPRLYLSWHAPYGMPGGSDTITFATGDTSRADTLYLSFDPGGDGPAFDAMWVRLYFHPQTGDTLGPYWRYNHGEPNWGNLRIQSDPDPAFPCPQPWIRNGVGQPDYQFDPAGSRLDFIYGILRDEDAIPLSGRLRYCFARVLFHQNGWQLPGARQPVCIEWSEARLSFGGREIAARHGAQRFVTANSPGGSVCRPYRSGPRPRPWRPGLPAPPRPQP